MMCIVASLEVFIKGLESTKRIGSRTKPSRTLEFPAAVIANQSDASNRQKYENTTQVRDDKRACHIYSGMPCFPNHSLRIYGPFEEEEGS